MQVFAAEKEAGLEHQIKTQSSIAYESPILLDEKQDLAQAFDNLSISTAAMDDKDIYHVYSILVTTSWNKNDDVFDKAEVWAAQNTPKYKPANLEHDERQIVGGIVDNWSVDKNMKVIDKHIQSDSLPDYYHILVASVIYRQWQDPAYQTRAENLIKEIEAGNKFVSMECLFNGFDYAVVDPGGDRHILARNDETAFLTKHLRAYGGKGGYEDHKIGRLLRNIVFSGKGFVNKPANPDSIIFDKNKLTEFDNVSISSKNLFSTNNGVTISVEKKNQSIVLKESNMSTDLLNDQVKELKEALAAVQADNKELTDKLSKANLEKYDVQIKELTDNLQSLAVDLKASEEVVASKTEETQSLQTQLTEATEDLAKAQSELQDIEHQQKIEKRVAALVGAGLSEEDAEAKMEIFDSLTDDQFSVMVETVASVKPEEVEEEVKAEETEAQVEEEVEEEAIASDEEVLETAEAEEFVDLSVEADTEEAHAEEIDTVRAGLKDWVNNHILNK
ncbi:MAG: hypothetical protein MK217_05115 [Gammaproteobacteria bacterium]|nr:hypothetical protein [Gammaproteobacteria bacterium]